MKTVYNFCSGPATLPQEVLDAVQVGLRSYKGTGMSVMELGHRSKWFDEILQEAVILVRELLSVPDDYSVFFMHGGASIHFALLPLNFSLLKKALYIDTGIWSSKAIQEAEILTSVEVIASGKDFNYQRIPPIHFIESNRYEADYIHLTSNNTIYGTQFTEFPDTGDLPLVVDMTSDIFSRQINVGQFGMIYAGAQKNFGIAGLSLCIVRRDLLERISGNIPKVLSYKLAAENNSRYHTPNTWAIYVAGEFLKWIKKEGGVQEMERRSKLRAKLIYDTIDNLDLFANSVESTSRSMMNIPFTTGDDWLDNEFVEEAEKEGLMQLAGHRTLKGIRASMYNGMPIEGAQRLQEFLSEFAVRNGK